MKKWFWGNCLGMLITCTLLVVGLFVFVPIYTRHGQSTTVPQIKGLSLEKAQEKVEDAGLKFVVKDTVYNKKMPHGMIVRQHLTAGNYVKKGRTVKVTINSTGAPMIVLPDIADNCSRQEACMRLVTLGFKLGPIKYIKGEGDWVYAILVKGREVKAGTAVSADDELVLVVGEGGLWEEEEVEFFNPNRVYGSFTSQPDSILTDSVAIDNSAPAETEISTQVAM